MTPTSSCDNWAKEICRAEKTTPSKLPARWNPALPSDHLKILEWTLERRSSFAAMGREYRPKGGEIVLVVVVVGIGSLKLSHLRRHGDDYCCRCYAMKEPECRC